MTMRRRRHTQWAQRVISTSLFWKTFDYGYVGKTTETGIPFVWCIYKCCYGFSQVSLTKNFQPNELLPLKLYAVLTVVAITTIAASLPFLTSLFLTFNTPFVYLYTYSLSLWMILFLLQLVCTFVWFGFGRVCVCVYFLYRIVFIAICIDP